MWGGGVEIFPFYWNGLFFKKTPYFYPPPPLCRICCRLWSVRSLWTWHGVCCWWTRIRWMWGGVIVNGVILLMKEPTVQFSIRGVANLVLPGRIHPALLAALSVLVLIAKRMSRLLYRFLFMLSYLIQSVTKLISPPLFIIEKKYFTPPPHQVLSWCGAVMSEMHWGTHPGCGLGRLCGLHLRTGCRMVGHAVQHLSSW